MLRTYKNIVLSLILIVSALSLAGQTVSFTIDAPSQVRQNEQFRVTYSCNKDGDFKGVKFTNFQLLGGPSVSSQTSMSIVNGRTSRTSKKTYTYYLRSNKAGTFVIPAAKIEIENKIYKSAEKKIEVIKNDAPKNSPKEITNSDFKPKGKVFIKSLVSTKNAYMGEPIILTQKLYSKENIANITDFKEPTLTNFYKENIDIGDIKLSTEVINGVKYNVVILKKSILFPQKSGSLEIGNFDLEVIVQIVKSRRARDRMEQMMYGNTVRYYDNKELKLKSPKIKINIKPLPSNKPSNFIGIVGNFKMTATVDKNKLKTNDALNLKVKIQGKGNIELLEVPKINFPPDFEIYDPKISKSIKRTTSGVSGSKSYEYLIIPGNEGDFTIPSFGFTYFNPKTKKYESCESNDISIEVIPGEGGSNNSNIGVAVSRDEIKYVGKDIHHINSNIGETTKIGDHKFNSWAHIIWMALSPIFAILLIILFKKQEEKFSNKSLMRHKKATKMAKKRLKVAKKAMEENNETLFYEETSKSLWGYLADKFTIDQSILSMEIAKGKLMEKYVDNDSIIEISGLIERCEYARYAPNSEIKGIKDIYVRSIDVISKIEKTLK
ncbi:MAG: protein BatD [Bacteroidales bacterium]|nr:protein BatD [Bacteroidales bacterium]